MLKYSDYKKIFENYKLKYMAFDWDDNILFMPTKIHMQKEVNGGWIDRDVSTSTFAEVRNADGWRIKDNDPNLAFSEFRDEGPRGNKAFIEDAMKALNDKKFGPSWDQFIKCLIRGNIFAIITARGHEPETIRKVVEYIIEEYLDEEEQNEMAANLTAYHNLFYNTDHMKNFSFEYLVDYYLSHCEFIGVSSDSFIEKTGGEATASDPEKGKKISMELFIDKIHLWGKKVDREVVVGFSDDDKRNVDHIHKFFKNELSLKYLIDYNIFDTSNPDKEPKKIEEVKTFEQFKSQFSDEWINPINENEENEKDYSKLKMCIKITDEGEIWEECTILTPRNKKHYQQLKLRYERRGYKQVPLSKSDLNDDTNNGGEEDYPF